jgi:nitrogen fixation protein FixH
MLAELKQAHEELLGYISELEAVVAQDMINASALGRVRLQLSKASSRRRRVVTEAILRLSRGVTVEEQQRLNLLRENDAALLAATSSHVGEWSIDTILADCEGYRAASTLMRKSMRERIATERQVLYPLLERVEP